MELARGNLLANIPASLPSEAFETLAQNDAVRIERILSRGHSSGQDNWYDQSTDEWVMLLSGQARLEMAGSDEKMDLVKGDWVLIPAGTRHRVDWTDPVETCIWLAVHFAACRHSSPAKEDD